MRGSHGLPPSLLGPVGKRFRRQTVPHLSTPEACPKRIREDLRLVSPLAPVRKAQDRRSNNCPVHLAERVVYEAGTTSPPFRGTTSPWPNRCYENNRKRRSSLPDSGVRHWPVRRPLQVLLTWTPSNRGETLMAGNVREFTDSNFEAEVVKSAEPVLVDFWAPWCGPCRQLTPVIEQLATENAAGVKVGKLNIDDNPQAAQQYGVSSIPTAHGISAGPGGAAFRGCAAQIPSATSLRRRQRLDRFQLESGWSRVGRASQPSRRTLNRTNS